MWLQVKSLPVPRLMSAAACLCSDGRCAVLGGWDGDKLLDTVYVYGEPDESSGNDEASESAQSSAAAASSAVEPECEGEDWHSLAAMAQPAADFAVVSDRSFGTLVLRSCEKTNEVLVRILPNSRYPARTHSHILMAYRMFG